MLGFECLLLSTQFVIFFEAQNDVEPCCFQFFLLNSVGFLSKQFWHIDFLIVELAFLCLGTQVVVSSGSHSLLG